MATDYNFKEAKQSFKDLFRWRQRVVITDQSGVEHVTYESPSMPPNPIGLVRSITLIGWGAYLIGFFCWTADAFDFHALSIQSVKLSKHFGISKTEISTAITLTLLLRSVGAALFGCCADYFGRKYPLAINMWILGALQVGSIYAPNWHTFLAIRALFGLGMGGVYGAAASMALENIPIEARGLMSGIFQQGYSFGYVLAACTNLGVGGAVNTWPIMFWVGAAMSFTAGLARLVFPESRQFLEAKANSKGSGTAQFAKNFGAMLKQEWKVCVYAIILMSWFNWFSHSSQDSYTTFMLVGKQLNNSAASRASILMKTGACVGGTFIGYFSQWLGRRRAMILACFMVCCLIPAWVLPTSESGLEGGGFMLQFFVQGAWGVVPIYLSEVSPPAFRAIFVGLTYQLGNAISSPSTQLINYLSENNYITNHNGRRVQAYGPVMAVATAIIAIGLAVTASVGPERKGRHFEDAAAADAVAHTSTAPAYDQNISGVNDSPSNESLSEKESKMVNNTKTSYA